jgi:N-acetylmuramoyl-L-alanine amidase
VRLRFYIAVLLLCLANMVFAIANYAWGEFKPLTREEPVVRMVLQEAANEIFAGQVAVAGVAYDRLTDSRWPATLHGVIYQPAQFTGMSIRLRDYSQAQITRARIAVAVAESGTRPCGTVLWYHTNYVSPSWRKRLARKCQLGVHIFYGDR